MAVFAYHRVSLTRRDQIDAFEPTSKHAFFKDALASQREFTYRARRYIYLPIEGRGDVQAGLIGRELKALVNAGPDKGFALVEKEEWSVAFLFADIGEDRQIVALQQKAHIPDKVLARFLETAARSVGGSWVPTVEYISNADDFWAAAKQYEGKISSINFRFLPPNMLRATKAVNNLIKIATDQPNAETVDLRLNSPHKGIKPEGEFIESALDTATKGGGEVSMKSGNKVVYSSEKNKVTKEVDQNDLPQPTAKDKIIEFANSIVSFIKK